MPEDRGGAGGQRGGAVAGAGGGAWYQGPGIRTRDVLGSPSTVRIHVVDMFTNERHIVALDGGVTAVSQDADGRLAPISGWALRPQ